MVKVKFISVAGSTDRIDDIINKFIEEKGANLISAQCIDIENALIMYEEDPYTDPIRAKGFGPTGRKTLYG